MNVDDNELECRVCREGGTDDHQLFAPCLCNGSILYVHQDCLEEWLSHSGKDFCELCKIKYKFSPLYAPNTPEVIPLTLVISSLGYSIYLRVFPIVLRLLLAILCWLVVVPINTCFIYRFFMSVNRSGGFLWNFTIDALWNDAVEGIATTCVVGLSTILLVSFSDFIRQFWNGREEADHHVIPENNIAENNHDNHNNVNIPNRLPVHNPNDDDDDRHDIHHHEMAGMRAHVIEERNGDTKQQEPEQEHYDDEDEVATEVVPPFLVQQQQQQHKNDTNQNNVINTVDDLAQSKRREKYFNQRIERVNTNGFDSKYSDAGPRSTEGDDDRVEELKQDTAMQGHREVQQSARLARLRFGHLSTRDIYEDKADFVQHEQQQGSVHREENITSTSTGEDLHAGDDRVMQPDAEADSYINNLILENQERTRIVNALGGVEGDAHDDVDIRALLHADDYEDLSDLDSSDSNDSDGDEDDVEEDIFNDVFGENQNGNNNNDNNENNNNNNNINGGGGGGGARGAAADDARLALGELAGLRGPLMNIVRGSLWLIAFNLVFIFSFIYCPYYAGNFFHVIGTRVIAKLLNVLSVYVESVEWFQLATSMIHYMYTELVAFLMESLNHNKLLRAYDLFFVCLGYSVLVTYTLQLIFFIGKAYDFTLFIQSKWNRKGAPIPIPSPFPSPKPPLLKSLELFAGIIKVMWLLGIRIFFLPCVVGFLMLNVINSAFNVTFTQILLLMHHNILGVIGISWGLGISFMLTTTISVLQLREILHPDYLSKIIKPQEIHSDILNALCKESIPSQFRRLVISFTVYVILVILFVYIPLSIYINIFIHTLKFEYFTFYFWNFAPELLLPLEMGMAHIIFLVVLEQHKNKIGYAQYAWLHFMCHKLHISRYLLPFSYKQMNSDELSKCGNYKGIFCYGDKNEKYGRLGKAMLRPPLGWDARTKRSKGRWAWKDEEVLPIEKTCAPRAYPKHKFVSVFILCVASWVLTVLSIFAFITLPFAFGRLVLTMLHIPTHYWHDPITFCIGIFAIQWCRYWLNGVYSVAKCLMSLPASILTSKKVYVMIFHWLVSIPLLCGILFYVLVLFRHHELLGIPTFVNAVRSLPHTSPVSLLSAALKVLWSLINLSEICLLYLFGSFLCNGVLIVIISGLGDSLLKVFGLEPYFMDIKYAIEMAWLVVSDSLNREGGGASDASSSISSGISVLNSLCVQCPLFFVYKYVLLYLLQVALYICYPIDLHHKNIVFSLLVILLMGVEVSDKLMKPLKTWMTYMYKTIKDDFYLVGKQLNNYHEGEGNKVAK